MTKPRLAFIGFGEAGQAFAAGLRSVGVEDIAAWDILFPDQAGEKLRQACRTIGVREAASAPEAVKGADIVFSAVTAASSLEAARSVASALSAPTFFLDINSVSPGRKQETAKLFTSARYVDLAVMAPVFPARHQTPLLLGGPNAAAVEPVLRDLAMKATIAGPEIGNAAAIKMVRSVMIKGLEALTFECFLAASRAGVEEQIIASLSQTYPGLDWRTMVDYALERMTTHGIRRAAELREVADTLRELHVAPHMTEGATKHQQQLGELGRREPIRPEQTDLIKSVGAALGRQSH